MAAFSTSSFGLNSFMRSGSNKAEMTQPKPSLERGLIFRNRLGSHSKDYETRLTNKTDGDGHGARKVDKGYGLRLQPGKTETGEACNGCMRTFRTIRGVRQHQRLTKCLEKYQADRIYKSKAVGIRDKHHSDTDSCLPVTRPMAASGGACIPRKTDEDKEECPMQSNCQAEDNHLSKDDKENQDTPSTGSLGKEERNSQKDETKLPEQKENNTEVKLGKEEREEEEAEPVEEFSILPGITVKTFSRDKKDKCKGSKFYHVFRNSSRKPSRAIDQGDIRLWAKKAVNNKSATGNKTENGKEKEKTSGLAPEAKETTVENNRNRTETEIEPTKQRLKSVVYKVKNESGPPNKISSDIRTNRTETEIEPPKQRLKSVVYKVKNESGPLNKISSDIRTVEIKHNSAALEFMSTDCPVEKEGELIQKDMRDPNSQESKVDITYNCTDTREVTAEIEKLDVIRNKQMDLRTWLNSGQEPIQTTAETDSTTKTEKRNERDVIRVADKQADLRSWLNNEKQEPIHKTTDIYSSIQAEENTEQKENQRRTDIKTINQQINTGSPNDTLSKNGYLEMKRCDYRSLTGRNLVNDKVIDEYMYLIKERNKRDNLIGIGTLSVHMYKMLDQDFESGYLKTRNWIKEDLTNKDIILVPIHKHLHWSLIVVDMRDSTISYYDSIIGNRKTSNAPRVMKKYMERYCGEKGREVTFSTKIREDAPTQGNSVDCGVFVCQNAEKIAREAYCNTRQEDMDAARVAMMLEIFKGELSVEGTGDVRKFINLSAPLKGITTKKVKTGKQKREDHQKETRTGQSKKPIRNNLQKDPRPGQPEKINWPQTNSKEWGRFEEDVAKLLSILDGPPDRRAIQHPKIIFEMGKERFGLKEKDRIKSQNFGLSRRQKKCEELRQDINKLKKAYYEAPKEEKAAIQDLQQEKLKQLRLSKRAESLRKNRRKLTKNCNSFLRQPFQFARELINPRPKGNLENTKEEVETFLKKAHSDPGRNEPLRTNDDLCTFAEPEVPLKDHPPTLREFNEKLRKTRSKSAPGPNGVPYLVYKRCPAIAKLMYSYLRGLWVRNQVSESWKEAEGVLIPKEEGATDVSKFRTISLLNVEGKLYFSFKAKRLLDYLLGNRYIDTAIQKGGIPGVSGCLEHTALISQLIQEAKTGKKNLVVTWLDITNAYGSIPHKLIRKALETAHVSERMLELIDSYYDNAKIRFTTKQFRTDWQKLEKGIITGCTLSVVLFTLTMTWLVKSAEKETKGPITASGQQQKNSRLFMDDLCTTTETTVQTKYLLNKLEGIFNWAGLGFKDVKCRALVMIKGKIERRDIYLNEKPITLLQDNPAKYLGKAYDGSLKEQDQIKQVEKEIKQTLKTIENCKLPGRYKCWIIQNMFLKRTMWPLSIYNIPFSKIEEFQRLITAKLKKWLGLPRQLTVDAIYSNSNKLQLPFTALTEEVKVTKARNLITFQESTDPCVQNADIQVDAGRKANTKKEIEEARSRLKMRDIAGIANKGREGLGLNKRQYYNRSSQKNKRKLVAEEIRKKEEETRQVRMVALAKQGASSRWEVPERSLSHNDLIKTPEAAFKFLVKSVYDLLPTPANKNTWFGTEEKCTLCGKEATLNHILTGCQVALAQGRYKWRHDQVLKTLTNLVEEKRLSTKDNKVQIRQQMKFLKEGEKPIKEDKLQRENNSFLNSAKDWKLEVDLKRKLKVPTEITTTNLRPDMMLISNQTKQASIIELTVPNEDRVEVSGELKRNKYEAIAVDGRQRGWRVRIWAVEVGCRGFPASSMASFVRELGYRGRDGKKALDKISHVTEMASRSIWNWSQIKNW